MCAKVDRLLPTDNTFWFLSGDPAANYHLVVYISESHRIILYVSVDRQQ